MDLTKLRELAISSNVDERAVTVNTRALIDKVLARYSGEWTTLRELIQNAADASASKVVIKLETQPSTSVPLPSTTSNHDPELLLHTLSHHTLHRLIVSNNGDHFTNSDWERLQRIAEGNPDETKIGAFGVGFYSVFADCEEPFVVSGQKSMAFIWKGNSLFTKTTDIPKDQASSSQDTSFVLNYRSSSMPIPDLVSVCTFLCTSLTFVNLKTIEFWIDNWNIIKLQKTHTPGGQALLSNNISPKTKDGWMKITSVDHQNTEIEATWMNVLAKPIQNKNANNHLESEKETPVLAVKSFFSKLAQNTILNTSAKRAQREKEVEIERKITENPVDTSNASVSLRTSTVNIQTSVPRSFAQELERATKKPPPKNTRIAILTAPYVNAEHSVRSSGITADKSDILFSSVVPTKSGRIFIGFPTQQTTGTLCHISAPSIIPTVERESIDLNARHVKTWNTEMLRVAGIACRVAYDGNMQTLKSELMKRTGNNIPSDLNVVSELIPHATHILSQFCAKESTPLPLVGQLIEESFWDCGNKSVEILSTRGILPSTEVRIVPDMYSFLGSIAIIPPQLSRATEDFMRKLYVRNLISDLNVGDVKNQLESQALNETQLVEFLRYLVHQLDAGMQIKFAQAILKSAVGTYENEDGQLKTVAFNQIKHFLDPNRVSPKMPLPISTAPFKLTKTLKKASMSQFGWEELNVFTWFQFLLNSSEVLPDNESITRSMPFAMATLNILSKSWDSMTYPNQTLLIDLMSGKKVIPTKFGLRVPSDAYLQNVKVFEDLPTVPAEWKISEKFLVQLGVRKTVEMSLVLQRLTSDSTQSPGKTNDTKWSFIELIRYLASVQSDIPAQDLSKLRGAKICPIHDFKSGNSTGRLVSVGDVHEPLESNVELEIPTLHWAANYSTNSKEAFFLRYIGIKTFPSAQDVIEIMANSAKDNNRKRYEFTLKYFLEHFDSRYSAYPKARSLKYLPISGAPFPTVESPSDCYSNEKVSILGYKVLRSDLKHHDTKFGVVSDPSIEDCIDNLIRNPPSSAREAMVKFGYFFPRLHQIDDRNATKAGNAFIIPITKGLVGNQKVRMASPRMCFLGDSSTYGQILDFVDFGNEANTFLLKIGSKQEPTVIELARMIQDDPSRVLSLLGHMKYLELIIQLAQKTDKLRSSTLLWNSLKETEFLIAYKDNRLAIAQKEGDDDNSERNFSTTSSLRRPRRIVVNDNHQNFVIFREYLYTAPLDSQIEQFYAALGAPKLSSLLTFEEKFGGVRKDQTAGIELRSLIIERARLFLHEHEGRQSIVHDVRWLDKNLQVYVVDSLMLTTRLNLTGVPPFKEAKTAVLTKRNKEYILYITPQPVLYEVSRALISLLINNPIRNDVLAFEMVLDSDLRKLSTKGYDVDRILRQKQLELAKIAEAKLQEQIRRDKEQAKQAEEQAQREKELLEQKNKSKSPEALTTSPTPVMVTDQVREKPPPPYSDQIANGNEDGNGSLADQGKVRNYNDENGPMPGSFDPESPERPSHITSGFGGGLFNSIKQNMGNMVQQIKDRDNNQYQQIQQQHKGSESGTPPTIDEPRGPTDAIGNYKSVEQNIRNAIKSCRSHNSNTVFKSPTTTNVQEAKGSYCDSTPAQDLIKVGTTDSTIMFYVSKSIRQGGRDILNEKRKGIALFALLLLDVASLFGLRANDLHMYLDPGSKSIAFNASGALFFNYDYFESLHLQEFQKSKNGKIDAMAYWYVTLCHELAHNLVKTHSAEHSFYTESFASQYFTKAMNKALQY